MYLIPIQYEERQEDSDSRKFFSRVTKWRTVKWRLLTRKKNLTIHFTTFSRSVTGISFSSLYLWLKWTRLSIPRMDQSRTNNHRHATGTTYYSWWTQLLRVWKEIPNGGYKIVRIYLVVLMMCSGQTPLSLRHRESVHSLMKTATVSQMFSQSL